VGEVRYSLMQNEAVVGGPVDLNGRVYKSQTSAFCAVYMITNFETSLF
jgi:hypothetical protein